MRGQCHCGGVTFDLQSDGSSSYCHCGVCRRTTGGAFIQAIYAKPETATVTLAEGVHLQAHRTSDYLLRQRCSRCGAAIRNEIRIEGRSTIDAYMATLLDDPSQASPTHHIYYANRVVDVADDLPKFDGYGRP